MTVSNKRNEPKNNTASFLIEDPFCSQEGHRRRYALGRVKTVATLYIEKKRKRGSHTGEIFLDGPDSRTRRFFKALSDGNVSGKLLRKARSHLSKRRRTP